MQNGTKSIQLSPIHSASIRLNWNQLESFRPRIDFNWKFVLDRLELRLIRIYSDWSGMNRINSDWFSIVSHQTRYKTFFRLVQNGSETDFGITRICSYSFRLVLRIEAEWIELIQIDFWPFFIKRDTKRFSDWFRMVRKQTSE